LGRAQARKEDSIRKNDARDAEITKGANSVKSAPPNPRGLTFNHQVQVAVVALHTATAEEKSTEQALNTYIFQISQQSLKVDRLYKRAERLGGTDEENKHWNLSVGSVLTCRTSRQVIMYLLFYNNLLVEQFIGERPDFQGTLL
jgi:hypothetical protein